MTTVIQQLNEETVMAMYEMADGQQFRAATPRQLVSQMMSGKMTKPNSRASYRRATAERALTMYGYKLDPSSDTTLVDSMIACGLMFRMK